MQERIPPKLVINIGRRWVVNGNMGTQGVEIKLSRKRAASQLGIR